MATDRATPAGRRSAFRWVLLLTLIGVVPLMGAPLRWIDVQWLNESVRDAVGRWYWDERWADLPAVGNSDYRWLRDQTAPILVAHALGGSGGSSQNTLEAMRAAASVGATLFEVDLWLDDAGRLRCHHGPEAPGPYGPASCDFSRLLDELTRTPGHVVVDIKTDFAATGERAATLAQARGLGARVVFQLYRPADAMLFNRWSARAPLAGPIITAYRSHRGLRYLAAQASRLGVQALVVPMYRLPALRARESGITVFVHPAHDCVAVREGLDAGVSGLFVTLLILRDKAHSCWL